jgi:hypothetical protein
VPPARPPSQAHPSSSTRSILNNVAYFVGRALAGEDTLEPLTGRAEIYANRVRWIQARRAWIVGQLERLLEGEEAAGAPA